MMLIRTVHAEDIVDVMAVECACFADPYPPEILIFYYEFYPDGFLVAEVDRRVVGYVICDPDMAEIISLGVLPEYRKRGIGTALAKAAIAYMSRAGIKKIIIHVRSSNLEGQKFWRWIGFKKIRIEPKYYPEEPAVVMEYVIDPNNF